MVDPLVPALYEDRTELLVLPYTERQLIVVEPTRPSFPPARPELPRDRARGIERLRALAEAPGGAIERARERRRERQGAKRAGAEDLRPLHVEIGMANRDLRFPPSHPHERVVYVADPVRAGVYYPASDFHRKAFERKFSDAVRLLMGLGATRLMVVYREGWGQEFAGELNVSTLIHKVKSEAQKKADQDSEILFTAELEPNDPVVPDGLAWLEHEPNWQDVVEGRVQRGLRKFNLILSYRDSFRVDSNFEGKVKAMGFSAGGRLDSFRSTRWDIQGEFSPTDGESK